MANNATAAQLTIFTHEGGPLTKRIRLDQNGQLVKEVAAQFSIGTYQTVSVGSAAELAELVKTLNTSQALSYCVSKKSPSGKVVTKKRLSTTPGAVARSKEYFSYQPGKPGIIQIDCDADPDGGALQQEELWEILCKAMPGIEAGCVVWFPSAGSCIYRGDTELIGVRGQRFLILVKDAGDIRRAGTVLVNRLWLAGLGRIQLSASGAKLERTPVDGTVWDGGGRLDFVSGSVVEPPLEQRRGEPQVMADGGFLDTRMVLPDLTPDESERLEQLIDEAKKTKEAEALLVRLGWEAARTGEVRERLIRNGVPPIEAQERASNTVSMTSRHTLLGDWVVTLAEGEKVTISTILQNKAKYDGGECLDPIEPDYQGGKVTGKLFLFGRQPVLHSFAHGSTTYRLYPQPRKLVLSARDSDTVRRIYDSAHLLQDIYSVGDRLVVISENSLRSLTPPSLVFEIGGVFACYKLNQRQEEIPCDFPDRAANMLLQGDLSVFPPLRAVVDHPFILPNGRIVADRGYDKETGYYLNIPPEMYPLVPERPSAEQVVAAFDKLFGPFSAFPYASAVDRGALVAALLSVVARPGLDFCPGTFFGAPTHGSGKSMLARSIKILATGNGGVGTWQGDEAELKKSIVAWMRAGRTCHIFDNVMGRFASPTLAGLMTGEMDGERILGLSSSHSSDMRVLWLATGNNASLDRDFSERWIRVVIDAKMERPSERRFSFSPTFECLEHRGQLICAALTILKAFHLAGAPDLTDRGCRFDQWSRTVRACVLWLSRMLPEDQNKQPFLSDPAISLFDTKGDTETAEQAEFLKALHALKSKPFTASEIGELAEGWHTSGNFGIVRGWVLNHLKNQKLTPQGVNRALNNICDRPAGGFMLRQVTESGHNSVATWEVVEV